MLAYERTGELVNDSEKVALQFLTLSSKINEKYDSLYSKSEFLNDLDYEIESFTTNILSYLARIHEDDPTFWGDIFDGGFPVGIYLTTHLLKSREKQGRPVVGITAVAARMVNTLNQLVVGMSDKQVAYFLSNIAYMEERELRFGVENMEKEEALDRIATLFHFRQILSEEPAPSRVEAI